MKKQINPNTKAHLLRGPFYLILLLAVGVIPFALGQRATTKQSAVADPILLGSAPGATSSNSDEPAGGTWTFTGSLNTARGSHTATLLPNGKVLVAGGINSSGVLASAELYDPASGTWTITAASTPHASFTRRRCYPTARCSSQEEVTAAALSRARNCT